MNADLHCHSNVSDGLLTPSAVVRRAFENRVELLALTDHDEVGGLDEAAATARALGLRFTGGVEISVTWAHETIHVVGLGIDWHDPVLVAGLAATRDGRGHRAREMADELAAVGVPGAYEGALRHAGNPALISRTHFARFLVETGVCRDVPDVFARFLTEGRPGFVPHRWARLSDAVGWIDGAGGVAVLAHPGRYRLDETRFWALLDEFRAVGGRGIEVMSGSHSPDDWTRFAEVAKRTRLAASRGSDFHGPGESRTDLGMLPPLPPSLEPVWSLLS